MRKVTWIILLIIALIWLAIATFWTGSEDSTKVLEYPIAHPTLTPELSPSPSASPSIEIQVSPIATSSVNIDIRY